MGIVQGLTEFLPVSSSGHLIIVPFLFGWTDPFITSLAFSVMLHIGTLAALLVYFRADWAPARAGRASRPSAIARSGDDPDRRLAWLLVAATDPGRARRASCSTTPSRTTSATSGRSSLTLVVGAVILWLADRWGARTKGVEDVTFPLAIGIGAAQALALDPGHQPLRDLDLGGALRRPRTARPRPASRS